jgi:hypothetical protein
VQVGSEPPSFVIQGRHVDACECRGLDVSVCSGQHSQSVYSHAYSLPVTPSYQRFLSNKLRQEFQLHGVPLRMIYRSSSTQGSLATAKAPARRDAHFSQRKTPYVAEKAAAGSNSQHSTRKSRRETTLSTSATQRHSQKQHFALALRKRLQAGSSSSSSSRRGSSSASATGRGHGKAARNSASGTGSGKPPRRSSSASATGGGSGKNARRTVPSKPGKRGRQVQRAR